MSDELSDLKARLEASSVWIDDGPIPLVKALEKMTNHWIESGQYCEQTVFDLRDALRALLAPVNAPEPRYPRTAAELMLGCSRCGKNLKACMCGTFTTPAPSAPVPPKEPPLCEECGECGGMCSNPACDIKSDLCTSQARLYDHCVFERTIDGTCGLTGRLFVKKGGAQ